MSDDDDEKAAVKRVEEIARKTVSEVLGGLFDSGKYDVVEKGPTSRSRRASRDDDGADEPRGGRSIRDEVLAAVNAAKEKDAEQSERQKLQDKIRELEERTERKPRQFRPITRAMWGDED